MGKSDLEETIAKLKKGEYTQIGYRPPVFVQKKLAQELETGNYRSVAELLTKIFTEWLRDRELNTVYKKEKQVK